MSSVTRRWRTLDLVKVLQFLVLDHTIKRGSWVSSLIQIELALEISHTCSNSAHDSSKNSRKHLKDQKLEEGINSKSIQQKTTKLAAPVKPTPRRRCNRRASDEPMARPRPNSAMQIESCEKISAAPVESMPKEHALVYSPHIPLLKEHVLRIKNQLQH